MLFLVEEDFANIILPLSKPFSVPEAFVRSFWLSNVGLYPVAFLFFILALTIVFRTPMNRSHYDKDREST